MADENSFSDALEDLDEESKATGRMENNRNDNVEHSNPETKDHHFEINSSFDSNRNVSATSFSRETRIASNCSEQFNIPSYGRGLGIFALDSIPRAQPSSFVALEESHASSFSVPIAAPSGIVHTAVKNQSNLPSQSFYETRIWRPWSEMEPQNASFGCDINSCREEKDSASIFLPEQKLTSPEEREESGAARQTAEDGRQLSGTSAVLSPTEDVSSMESSTNRASEASLPGAQILPSGFSSRIEISPDSSALGSRSDASAVSVAGPSGTQAQSKKTVMEGSFVCDVCSKAFAKRSNLEAHYRTHTGEKPFECGTCKKGFAQQGNLTAHLLTHTGERRFSCEVCGKTFTQKHHLEDHVWTHSGEKPYKCRWCGRGFSYRSNYRRHLKHVHGQE